MEDQNKKREQMRKIILVLGVLSDGLYGVIDFKKKKKKKKNIVIGLCW